MKSQLRPALVVFGLLTIVTGVVYPLVVTAIGQGLFSQQANGSLIRDQDGKPVGSTLIAQPFDAPHYFWSRPSATSPFANNSGSSTGSNLGPTNSDLTKAIGDRIETVRKAHPDQTGPVPADLVTASASGLDPHISPGAAEHQVSRIASARNVKPDDIRRLVTIHTEGRTLGLLGEPRVNVLELNRDLDDKFPVPAPVAESRTPAKDAPVAPRIDGLKLQSLAIRGDEPAIAELQKLSEAHPTSGEVWLAFGQAQLHAGQFRAAANAFREAAARYPAESAEQSIAETESRNAIRWAGLERRLPEILAGAVTPTTSSAWADFGEVCRYTGRYAAAAHFFSKAADEDSKYERPSAICAALAGFGRGTDAKVSSVERRLQLRQTALKALRANPEWTNDPALAPLTDPAVIAPLSETEQAAWKSLATRGGGH